jgi:bacterioferritin
MSNKQPFRTDVRELRARARASIDQGAVTPAYQGDVKQAIEILQTVLATEIVCVLRYTMNAIAATGFQRGRKGIRTACQRRARAHALRGGTH